MEVSLFAYEVSELLIGKQPLTTLTNSATIGDALSALKRTDESCLSVWTCSDRAACSNCVCVGKVCMVDIICFLCSDENLSSIYDDALQKPVQILLAKNSSDLVRRIQPHSSLLEAIDLMLSGAQNLIVPIQRDTNKAMHKSLFSTTEHNGIEYCWLTREDVIRFLLNSIGVFSSIYELSIESLDIISFEHVRVIHYKEPAKSAFQYIAESHVTQKYVAIVDENEKLIGEISPYNLGCCDESVVAAIVTLSAGDLMMYIDSRDPPEYLIKVVKSKLKEKNVTITSAIDLFEDEDDSHSLKSFNSSSSLNSSSSFNSSCSSNKERRLGGYLARMLKRSSEVVVCFPWSSLVAVMMQAVTHRVSYVWVVKKDGSVIGVVNFIGILKAFRQLHQP